MSNPPPRYAFSGTIEATRLSPAYRGGLVVVALAMLLLPLLYVGLIALTGAGVWWHLTTNNWILSGRGGGQWRLLFYATPAVIGLVLMFFMVKPILARPSKRQDGMAIEPEAEPTLFAFIHAVCRQVRAPAPRRVQVDCEVNASAAFASGPFAVFSNDLVLTIGLPLAAGLSIRELGGVLAHEFGHFAQDGGMRLTGIVRAVNAWFARVVYDRDEWDEKLEHWSRTGTWQVAIMLVIARGAVWVSRQLLTGLMLGGHALSCFMMRQMELDADSYEIKIAGSDAFVRTSARMRRMSVGAQLGYSHLREGLRSHRLPAAFPAFVIERCTQLQADLVAEVGATERAGLFDTHPSDAERVEAARRAANPGVLVGGDSPAVVLFRDFDRLSAAATRHHYEHDLGICLDAVTFIDTRDAVRQSLDREEDWRALRQFFGDNVSAYRPLRLAVPQVGAIGATELRRAWASAKGAMEEADRAQLAGHYRDFETLQGRRDLAVAARELLGGGFQKVVAADFGLTKGTVEEATAVANACEQEQRALLANVHAFETAAATRLALALQLGASSAERDDVEPLVLACNAFATIAPRVQELGRADFAVTLLHQNAAGSDEPHLTQKRIAHLSGLIAARLAEIRDTLGAVRCPTAFTVDAMTLAERCGLRTKGESEPPAEVVDRIYSLYFEILGRIVTLAMRAEGRMSPISPRRVGLPA
jgi:Zn-dependent protease with chaperone function